MGAETKDLRVLHEIAEPEVATLRDGREILLRRIRPEDAQGLIRGFRRLSPESIRLRFFAPLRELNPRFAERLADVDFVHRAAFVATFPGEDEIRAVARYEQDDTYTAEVAFVVADELHGQGIGTHMLEHLIQLARLNGIRQLTAVTLVENRAMLHLLRKSGLPMRTVLQGDTYRATLDLREPADAGA